MPYLRLGLKIHTSITLLFYHHLRSISWKRGHYDIHVRNMSHYAIHEFERKHHSRTFRFEQCHHFARLSHKLLLQKILFEREYAYVSSRERARPRIFRVHDLICSDWLLSVTVAQIETNWIMLSSWIVVGTLNLLVWSNQIFSRLSPCAYTFLFPCLRFGNACLADWHVSDIRCSFLRFVWGQRSDRCRIA